MKLRIGHAVEILGVLTTGHGGQRAREQASGPWMATGIVIDIHRGIVAIRSHHDMPSSYYCREEDVKIVERRKVERRAVVAK